MFNSQRHAKRPAASTGEDRTTVWLCLGLLGLIPILAVALSELVGSVEVAIAVSGIFSVTLMGIMPRKAYGPS
jgi:hypothetical protein